MVAEKIQEETHDTTQDVDIVEVDLPYIPARSRLSVLETIHSLYSAETIGDKLFIKVSTTLSDITLS